MSYKVTDTIIIDQSRNLNSIGIATFSGPVIVGVGTSTILSVTGNVNVSGIVTGSVVVAAKDPGTGIATDSTESIFGNGWRLSSPASTTYYRLATLPAGGGGNTFDHLIINGTLGGWLSNQQTPFEIYFSNRNTFTSRYISYGSIRSDVRILGISTNSAIEVWAQHQASQFTKLVYNITNSLQVIPVLNPVSTTTAPVGTTVFDSSTATPRFIINDSDNVGIGTISPSTRLDVAGEILSRRTNTTQEGGQITFTRAIDDVNAYAIDVYNDVGLGLTAKLRFIDVVAGAERAAIDKAGNFLIGSGSSTGTASQLLQVNSGAYFNGNLGIGTTNPLQRIHVLGNLLVAAGSSTGQHITQRAYELNNGTLSWEGSAGQLFSITNNLTTGSIFSVNDVSGIPSIDVNADGTVALAPYADGNVGIATTRPTSRLHVVGNGLFTGIVTATSFRGDGSQLTGITASGVGAISGITVRDEGSVVGTAGSVTSLNFVGGNIIATATGAGATITIADNLTGTSLNISGLSTLTTLTGTNINYNGIGTISTFNATSSSVTNRTGTNANFTGVGTIATLNSTVATLTNLGGTNINYSGVGTIATLNSTVATLTNLGGTNINYSGIGTIATFNATTSSVTNRTGTNLNISGIGTIINLTGTNLNFTGVSTFTNGPVLIGAATSTGTASQPLQVTGGAYVSGRFGIGTTNPQAPLHINYGNTPAGSAETLRLEVIGNSAGGRGPSIDFYVPAGGGTSTKGASIKGVSGYIGFEDGSGNNLLVLNTSNARPVGVGTVGVDWAASYKVLQVGSASALVNTTTTSRLYSNYYDWNGGGSYALNNGFYGSLVFDHSTGAWIFNNSGVSTTAGLTATPVERARLDSSGNFLIGAATSTGTASQRLQVTGGAYVSGNLGVGVTSPSFKADVAGDVRVTSTNKMRFGGTSGTTNFYIQYNSSTNSLDFVAG